MTTTLLDQGATIDKYMGDAIMAFWNAPIDQEDHRQRACQGLLNMRKALAKLNSNNVRKINIGIGLNSGACCVGNLGSAQRFNYSAIGDAVNVASRVEGLTKHYGLDNLITQETLDGTSELAFLEIDRVSVVGREQPLTVYTLLGGKRVLESAAYKNLLAPHQEMLEAYNLGDAEGGIANMARAGHLAEKLEDVSLLKVYALYAERFAVLRDKGVPEDWDGVFKATSK
jgi:adenylate cyclase